MTGFTPGPWLAKLSGEPVEPFRWYLYSPNYGAVGYWKGHKDWHTDPHWLLTEADARLIAAAPELYEALEGLLATHKQGRGQCCAAADKAIDALAKARGEHS